MNKQDIIEMMKEDMLNNIRAYDDNPKGLHLYSEQRKDLAEKLLDRGYVNGADFVEWLCEYFSDDGDFVSAEKEEILEALQEYLKGE